MSRRAIDGLNLPQLRRTDPRLAAIIRAELKRQRETLMLIPSENYVSPAVLEAASTVLTNKYAEGYPGKRHYNGVRNCDLVEQIAIDRAKAVFGAEHANVQPHAGSQANFAVYLALLNPGDKIMGMRIDSGGHLTHGMGKNFSGRWFNVISYGVNRETSRIDYSEVERLAERHKPKMIIAGISSYMFQIDFARFGAIARRVGAYLMSDIAHIAGMVVAKLHPDPVPHSTVVTATLHKTLRGPRGGLIVCGKNLASDIDRAVLPGSQGGPLMHVIAAKAQALKEAQTASFRRYQVQILKNSRAMAEVFVVKGIKVIGGGTENHLVVLDVTPHGMNGREAADLLEEAGIVVNKQMLPFDARPRGAESGIRLGSPAISTRGMKEPESRRIAEWMTEILRRPSDSRLRRAIRAQVVRLTRKFPIY